MSPLSQAVRRSAKPLDRADFEPTGPGTPAAEYLKRFWQPVYHAADLARGRAVPLKIMGERYTLYRGEDGSAHLTEARCPHRGTLLSSGWVEGSALRCFYHGWKFAADGTCVEQPAEELAFAHKVCLRSWPVREYLGLVFAYLGEGEPPAFPTFPMFERFRGLVEVDSYLRECNYFQNVENALDMSHVGFVHTDNQASFSGIGLGRQLSAEESDWGVSYTFHRADGARRVQQFGMPNVFYMTALPTERDIGWQELLFWWVPIDDTRHMQFSIHRVPIEGEAAERFKDRRAKKRTTIDLAHQEVCRAIIGGMMSLKDVDRSRVDLVRLQDDIAQVGQGIYASENPERLGRGDVGVIAIRRLWRREVNALAERKPLKVWRRPDALVPRVWQLGEGAGGEVALASTADNTAAEIIDIRPFVEVELQRKALHGGLPPLA